MVWNESTYNLPVDVEKTVRDLFDICHKLRGQDGTSNTQVRIGLLRRLADHLENDFEQRAGGFVRRRRKT